MQKANGLQLKMSGASYSSVMSEMVLGYSCHPHSIVNYEKTLAKTNMEEIRKKIHLAQKVSSIRKQQNKLFDLVMDLRVSISPKSKKNSFFTNGKNTIPLKETELLFTLLLSTSTRCNEHYRLLQAK